MTQSPSEPLLTLIEGGELYDPQPRGARTLLLAGGTILATDGVDRRAVEALGLPCRVVDARDCLITPGLIDPHQHLIGAGGEQGWRSRMPEVPLADIVGAGITTAVGCLGTDTTTRSPEALLAKVHELRANGISAYMYTGGFHVPPATISGSIRRDLILLDAVLGLGEIAIADRRSSQPSRQQLAELVAQALVGGMISGKAGVTHVHVGPGQERLALLRALVEQHEIPARALYPTHINHSTELLDEAIELARQGAYVDLDTVEDNLVEWLGLYCERGGPLAQLTVSSDAHTPGGSPARHRRNIVAAARDPALGLELVLPLCTRNPAAALGLSGKGRLAPGMDADVLVLRRATLDVVHVFAGGRQMIKDGQFNAEPTGAQQ